MSEKINKHDLNAVCITKRAASGQQTVLLYTVHVARHANIRFYNELITTFENSNNYLSITSSNGQ
jgi:hypothetical protein